MKQNLPENWINREYVQAFKWGDRCGLPFESGSMFPATIDEDRLQQAMKSAQGSDESSIVDCFIKFVTGYICMGRDQFTWDWCMYHQQHHGVGYGRTYRDHFKLVQYLDRHSDLYPELQSRIVKMLQIARDANSFGNGCLAIVYPAYCYARAIGEEPVAFVRYLVSFSHAHDDAMGAVSLMCDFIDHPERIADYCVSDDEAFRQRYCSPHATAYNTLMAAVKCAMQPTEVDVLREGIRIGGDTDSVLATAMLLWKLQH
ncbi:MAG: ADP-ribosylglycohydrolase family protein [Desulfobacter sp.]